MLKNYHDLNWLQKLLIKRWFKRHSLHLVGLKAIGAVDVINLWNDNLLFSFYRDAQNIDKYTDLLERYNENYIIYENVIFVL